MKMIYMDYDNVDKKIENLIFRTETSQILKKVIDILYNNFDKYNWIGIYIVHGKDLILGPWKGQQATEHIKISVGKGVCGSAAKSGKTETVPYVNKDDRYLACFVTTQSEIVVPIKKNGKVIGEIDIDSDTPNAFDEKDIKFLEKLCSKKTFINIVEKERSKQKKMSKK
jgi:putative methionine-R-sulfoxide reductase with GAF domain